jgi:hypothetical protein
LTSLTEEQRTHDLGSAYTALGQSLIAQGKTKEAESEFDQAIRLISQSNQSEAAKGNSISWIHKSWAEAIVNLDCNTARYQLQAASESLPNAKKIATDLDWQSITYELSFLSDHCGADGKLRGDGGVMPGLPGQPATPNPIWPSPSGTQAINRDGGDTLANGEAPAASGEAPTASGEAPAASGEAPAASFKDAPGRGPSSSSANPNAPRPKITTKKR